MEKEGGGFRMGMVLQEVKRSEPESSGLGARFAHRLNANVLERKH